MRTFRTVSAFGRPPRGDPGSPFVFEASDAVDDLGSPTSEKLAHRVWPVTVAAAPHAKRTGATAPGCDGTLRVATNLPDVPAEIVALLDRYRGTIEIVFRFFVQVLGCRHLLDHSNTAWRSRPTARSSRVC